MSHHDPYLDQAMRLWIRKTARTHYWKIAGFDVDDLVQEGYICYYRCWNRYVGNRTNVWHGATAETSTDHKPGVNHRYLPVSNPDKAARRHFASLVQRAFMNRIYDLAKRQSSMREVPLVDLTPVDLTQSDYLESIMPGGSEVATVGELIRSAPSEIKQLFDLLISDAGSLPPSREASSRVGRVRPRLRGSRTRETNNQYFCRVLGLREGYDLDAALREHFGVD